MLSESWKARFKWHFVFALWVQCKIPSSRIHRTVVVERKQRLWSAACSETWLHHMINDHANASSLGCTCVQCSRLREKYGKAEASCNATPLNKQAATQMARVPELALATALIFVWKYLSTNVWKYCFTDVWKCRNTRCMCATTTPKITQELWRSFVNLSQLNKQCS